MFLNRHDRIRDYADLKGPLLASETIKACLPHTHICKGTEYDYLVPLRVIKDGIQDGWLQHRIFVLSVSQKPILPAVPIVIPSKL